MSRPWTCAIGCALLGLLERLRALAPCPRIGWPGPVAPKPQVPGWRAWRAALTAHGAPQVPVDLKNYKRVNRTFEETVDHICSMIGIHGRSQLDSDPDFDPPYLVVHISNPFWSFHDFRYAQHAPLDGANHAVWSSSDGSACSFDSRVCHVPSITFCIISYGPMIFYVSLAAVLPLASFVGQRPA